MKEADSLVDATFGLCKRLECVVIEYVDDLDREAACEGGCCFWRRRRRRRI